MGIWSRVGIRACRCGDLTAEGLEELSSWRRGGDSPLVVGDFDGLVSYLLNLDETVRDRRFYSLRNALASSSRSFAARGGGYLVILDAQAEAAVRGRLDELREADCRDLEPLSQALSGAMWSVSADGRSEGELADALGAWDGAADAMESFLSEPRRASRFDLEDLVGLPGTRGIWMLAEVLELYRRLLVAAGRAVESLGAATIGHYEFSGADEAVALWRVADGSSARRLGAALSRLVSRTSGAGEPPALPGPDGEGLWVLPYSRLGQQAMAWALERSALNFSGVGALWPGPSVYRDDYEEEPRAAYELLAEYGRAGRAGRPLLYGSSETVVGDDLTVAVPERFLDGDRAVYISEDEDLLVCTTELRRFEILAGLMHAEQGLEQWAWGDSADDEGMGHDAAEDFEREFSLIAFYDAVDDDAGPKGRVSLGRARRGMERGATVTVSGDADRFTIGPSSPAAGQCASPSGEDFAGLYFGDL